MAAQDTTATNEPTAYAARIVATGMATAAGAVLTWLIDSRGTLVGAVLVAMAASAIGQAMRVPLDRLERRIKALGVGRGILVIAVVGFTVGAGAAAAHEILGVGQSSARIARKLQPPASEEPVRATPTNAVPDDEDAKAPGKPVSPAASDADKQRPAQPAPAPSRTPEPVTAAARP